MLSPCEHPGCRKPGTNSPSTDGSGPWYCRAHGQPPQEQPMPTDTDTDTSPSPDWQPDDALDRLSIAMYGRRPKPADYLGGSDARVLRDAARIVVAAREVATSAERAGATGTPPALRARIDLLSVALRGAERGAT
jgi:hypothetical protein